jgi:hypothetical protein
LEMFPIVPKPRVVPMFPTRNVDPPIYRDFNNTPSFGRMVPKATIVRQFACVRRA